MQERDECVCKQQSYYFWLVHFTNLAQERDKSWWLIAFFAPNKLSLFIPFFCKIIIQAQMEMMKMTQIMYYISYSLWIVYFCVVLLVPFLYQIKKLEDICGFLNFFCFYWKIFKKWLVPFCQSHRIMQPNIHHGIWFLLVSIA